MKAIPKTEEGNTSLLMLKRIRRKLRKNNVKLAVKYDILFTIASFYNDVYFANTEHSGE